MLTRRSFLSTLVGGVAFPWLMDRHRAAEGNEVTLVAAQAPLPIGARKQLFVDDYVILSRFNVSRELGQVTKANNGNSLIVADEPWENADLFRLGSVIRDEGKFKMRYQLNSSNCGYAESEDGMNWTKPNLGLYEYQGSWNNNILPDFRGFTCLPDPHETDPAHKYKSAYGGADVKACIAHSADGFNWTPYNNGNPVTGRAADTLNQLLWDDYAQTYRLYTRTDFSGTIESRGTRDMANPDVKANPTNWTTIRSWRFDREGSDEYLRRQIYALNGWLYEGVHFGLLWCYEWPEDLSEGGYDTYTRHERDIMNFYILTCRGNEMWDMSWVYAQKPLIPRGPSGSFDKDWVQASLNIITLNDKHWIYYSGAKERHDIYTIRSEGQTRWQCAIGLATLRLDGFVCLEAKDEPGSVETKPFKLEGSKLEVNVDAKNGEVRVEVLDEMGNPIAGFTKEEARHSQGVDELRLQPRWNDHVDLVALTGRVVRLKFHLRKAKLYAFQVKPNVSAVRERKGSLISGYKLYANYPNPFNPVTEIRFDVPRQSVVRLEVFNILGQVVKTLVDEIKEAGYYRVSWDGRNSNGVLMPSGMYLYRLSTPDTRYPSAFTESKRMLLVR